MPIVRLKNNRVCYTSYMGRQSPLIILWLLADVSQDPAVDVKDVAVYEV